MDLNIGDNSKHLKIYTFTLKNKVTSINLNPIKNTNKLFIDKWLSDYKFLKDRTPFTLFEGTFKGHLLGHTFKYDSNKDPERTCFK